MLKNCFKDVFSDINEMVREKTLDVGGKVVNLEFFLGGDYKFILLIMGLTHLIMPALGAKLIKMTGRT